MIWQKVPRSACKSMEGGEKVIRKLQNPCLITLRKKNRYSALPDSKYERRPEIRFASSHHKSRSRSGSKKKTRV